LLGIVGSDGRVQYAANKIVIDEEFVKVASVGRTPEKRFRFSNSCVESRCKQWKDHHCSVLDKIIDFPLPKREEDSRLPICSIRPSCRWFRQDGAHACSVCPWVITEYYPNDPNERPREDIHTVINQNVPSAVAISGGTGSGS